MRRPEGSATQVIFFPRQYRDLVSRVLFDLKHWRRFILKVPSAKFDFVLGRLPESRNVLFSDASTSFGMAGVIRFPQEDIRRGDYAGFFWQLSWDD